MRKVVNPVLCRIPGTSNRVRGYAAIEWDGENLSIHGVVGPRANGGCSGSAGQCVDEIRAGDPAQGWTAEMVDRFCTIWERWHLNDMHPECEHQRKLGWREQAKKEITLYHYTLNEEARKQKREVEREAFDALRAGRAFFPTQEQTFLSNLEQFRDAYEPMDNVMAKYYVPYANHYHDSVETKPCGLVRPEEYVEGILGRPCPVCGYRYGSSWKREEVPEDIVAWLFKLPDAMYQPAWI